jgi:DnaD/phage-associated family protein
MCAKPALARCGLVAGILWHQGRSKCDGYGRLPGDPEILAFEVMPTWLAVGQVTAEAIRDARDAMARAHIWHLYRDPVTGAEYVEYEGYDAEQTPSYLAKRAARPTYPDPPDRPDLKDASRLHYQGKGKPAEPPTTNLHGSTDLSASAAGVPSPAQAQGAVPGHGVAEKAEAPQSGFERDGKRYRDWEHWFETKTATVPGQGRDAGEIRSMRDAGTEDALIVEAISRAIAEPKARMKLAYAKGILAEWALSGIRTMAQLQAGESRPAGDSGTPQTPEGPPDEDDDRPRSPYAERARQQAEALLRGDTHATAAAV